MVSLRNHPSFGSLALARSREALLPPRLVNDDRDGIREIQAAVAFAHRDADPLLG